MVHESVVHSIAQTFKEEKNKPIFAVYGSLPGVEEIVSGFQEDIQGEKEFLYLSLDIGNEKYETPEGALFALLQHLIDVLIDKIPESDENAQLLSQFRLLWNIRKSVRDSESEEQLAEFVRFTEFSCYPVLQEILRKRHQPVLIEFFQFEKIAIWGTIVYNFLLDNILQALEGINLRFVLFVNEDNKPRLFYGSNEESTKEKMFFYKLPHSQ